MTEKQLNQARQNMAGFFKIRREELNLSQQEVADRAGFSRATINRLENAAFWPGMKQYLLICEAMELDFVNPKPK